MTNVTLQIDDELAALLEQQRGEQDVATYALTTLRRAARRKARRQTAEEVDGPPELMGELTNEELLARAADARIHNYELDEFERLVRADFEEDRKRYANGGEAK